MSASVQPGSAIRSIVPIREHRVWTVPGTSGHKGQSFTIYDASRKAWHQTWVTNRGELLMIEGKFEGSEIVLSGSDRTSDGKDRLVRGTWKPVDGGVREFAVTSVDGGKAWTDWFDLMFRPHKE